MKTLIVIPTYNEADNLPTLIAKLMAALPDGADVLIADDNSPDGTGAIADKLAEEHAPRIKVNHRPGKMGLGRAYRDGFAWAMERGYDAVVEMDADLSHDPASAPELIAAGEGGADVVIGSRYLNGISVINWPLRRILLSLGANDYVRRILGINIHDATAGFRLYKRRVLEAINLPAVQSNGYSFQVEMTYRAYLAGAKIVEVPIVFTERRAGHSKMSQGVIMESAMMPWRLRFRRGKLLKSMTRLEQSSDTPT